MNYGQSRQFRCPDRVCDGSGMYWADAAGKPVALDEYGDPVDESAERRPCSCRSQLIEMRRLQRVLGPLPRRYRNVSFERNPVPLMDPDLVKPIRTYIDAIDGKLESGEGLWLVGTKGTGKTTLAALIMKHALLAQHTAAFWTYTDLLDRIKHSFDDPDESVWDIRQDLEQLDLLIVDDLGREFPSEYAVATAHAIINGRYNAGRATIITTNLTAEQLEATIGDAAVDRLYEVCGEPIVFTGESHRRRAA